METIETIIQWHKETFPDTTLEEQEQKFKLESVEFDNGYTDKQTMIELSDMVIVAFGIARFKKGFEVFSWAMDCINNRIKYLAEKSYTYNHNNVYEELQKAIDYKMKVNRKRKWHKVNGEWRHI